MKRTRVGTRFTTGCGHSWKRPRPWFTAGTMRGASTDCATCGELLIIDIPHDVPDDVYPANVHCPLFHPWLSKKTGGEWPADGVGSGFVEF